MRSSSSPVMSLASVSMARSSSAPKGRPFTEPRRNSAARTGNRQVCIDFCRAASLTSRRLHGLAVEIDRHGLARADVERGARRIDGKRQLVFARLKLDGAKVA